MKHSNQHQTVNRRHRNPATLQLEAMSEDKQREEVAKALSKPEVRAASVIQKLDGQLMDINCLVTELETQNAALQAGSLNRVEAMLGSQAHTLDALFANLARRSHAHLEAGHAGAAERLMRLALKAQAQAVRTVEALGELKNPRHIAYVAQANISNGHQQVNNSVAPHADQLQKPPNKLSEVYSHDLYTNAGTSSQAGPADSSVATLEAINRAYDDRG